MLTASSADASATAAASPVAGFRETAEAEVTGQVSDGAVQKLQSNPSLHSKAKAARAGFKRPAIWVLIFGWSLALCSGLVNVVAKQSFGTYVSHVTGTSTAVGSKLEGYHAGRHDFEPLGAAISVLVSFLFGAFLCGLLIDKNQIHFGGKSLYGVALVGNGLLLVLSVIVSAESKRVAACLTAVACGLQNAMCTSHFGAVVRTTHVTGTVTDIGSTLGRMSMIYLRRGCRRSRLNVLERAEVAVDARKLFVLLPMWLFFILGCIVGAYLGTQVDVYALFVPAGFTITVGLTYMLFRQRFKSFFKKLMEDRLNRDLQDVEKHLSRTQDYLRDLRKSNEQVPEIDSIRNPKMDLDGLESEVEHILDTIHQVEVDIEDLQSREGPSPFHRSDADSAGAEVSRGLQSV